MYVHKILDGQVLHIENVIYNPKYGLVYRAEDVWWSYQRPQPLSMQMSELIPAFPIKDLFRPVVTDTTDQKNQFDRFMKSKIANDFYDIPVLFSNALNGCWAHALLEDAFSDYWLMHDIGNACGINVNDMGIVAWNRDAQRESYTRYGQIKRPEVYSDLLNSISGKGLVCDSFLNDSESEMGPSYRLKNVFIPSINLRNRSQMSPWNKKEYFSNERQSINDWLDKNNAGYPLFSDKDISQQLQSFSTTIKQKLNVEDKKDCIDNTVRICMLGRKPSKSIRTKKPQLEIYNTILNSLNDLYNNNNHNQHFRSLQVINNGIIYLDNLSLKDQILVWKNNDVVISISGSALAHTIWYPTATQIIEIVFPADYNNDIVMHQRLSKLLGATHHQIYYQDIINMVQALTAIDTNIDPPQPIYLEPENPAQRGKLKTKWDMKDISSSFVYSVLFQSK